jgi:hypothetical protein
VSTDSLNSSVVSESENVPVHSSSRDYCTAPKNIPVIISEQRLYPNVNILNCQAQPKLKAQRQNLKTIKRSNKCLQALELPTMINLNPRSVYNKQNEFHTLVSELNVDLICMSESWEREDLTLDHIIDLDDHIYFKCAPKNWYGGPSGNYCQ